MANEVKIALSIQVVIVNYNTKDILRECLENLEHAQQLLDFPLEIYVADNASPDGSAAMVRQHFPTVKLLANTENIGIAKSYNLATRQSSSKYILYLGTDAFPSAEVLQGLVAYMDNHLDVGIATAELINLDGKIDMDAHRGFPTPWAALTYFTKLAKVFPKSKLFNQYFLGSKNFAQEHEIDACISHFMFTRRDAFNKIGGWDEDYFVFGEDIDFCYCIKKAGFKIMYLPQFEVLHYKRVSVGKDKKTTDAGKLKALAFRQTAMELFYTKHYQEKYSMLITKPVLWAIRVLGQIRAKL